MVLCNLPMDFELDVLIHEGLNEFSSYRCSVGPAGQPHTCHGEDESAAQGSGERAHLPFSGCTAPSLLWFFLGAPTSGSQC